MRQFTRWAQHLGGFLDHHGIPAFLGNHSENAAQDDDAEWRAFLWAWHNIFHTRQVTAADVRAHADPEPGRPDPWHGTFLTDRAGRPLTVKSLGRRLTGQIGRWRTDIVLRSVVADHARTRAYWVEPRTPETTPPNHPHSPMTSTNNPTTPMVVTGTLYHQTTRPLVVWWFAQHPENAEPPTKPPTQTPRSTPHRALETRGCGGLVVSPTSLLHKTHDRYPPSPTSQPTRRCPAPGLTSPTNSRRQAPRGASPSKASRR
jgi:hypothetical protein